MSANLEKIAETKTFSDRLHFNQLKKSSIKNYADKMYFE